MIIEKLFLKLKSIIGFSIFILIVILLNCFLLRYELDKSFINSILTLTAIVFGFLISAICNMFGRKITNRMSTSASVNDSGISQLQELKSDFLAVMYNGIAILMFSTGALVFAESNLWYYINCEMVGFVTSGIYLGLVIFQFVGITYLIYTLLNFLINETYLS